LFRIQARLVEQILGKLQQRGGRVSVRPGGPRMSNCPTLLKTILTVVFAENRSGFDLLSEFHLSPLERFWPAGEPKCLLSR
jgi:hypothetical protein